MQVAKIYGSVKSEKYFQKGLDLAPLQGMSKKDCKK